MKRTALLAMCLLLVAGVAYAQPNDNFPSKLPGGTILGNSSTSSNPVPGSVVYLGPGLAMSGGSLINTGGTGGGGTTISFTGGLGLSGSVASAILGPTLALSGGSAIIVSTTAMQTLGSTTFTGSVNLGSQTLTTSGACNLGAISGSGGLTLVGTPAATFGGAVIANTTANFAGLITGSGGLSTLGGNVTISLSSVYAVNISGSIANTAPLNVTNYQHDTFNGTFAGIAPNMSAGQSVSFVVGEASSTGNSAGFNFLYQGSNSVNNAVTMTFYGGGALTTLMKDGRYGINNTAPTATMHVGTLSAGTVGISVQATTNQTANLIQATSGSTTVWAVGADGSMTSAGSANNFSGNISGSNGMTVSGTSAFSTVKINGSVSGFHTLTESASTDILTIASSGNAGSLTLSKSATLSLRTSSGVLGVTIIPSADGTSSPILSNLSSNVVIDGDGSAIFGTFSLNNVGQVNSYANVSTVSGGVPAEYGTVDLTGRTAAIGATGSGATAYAVTSTGLYRLSFVATITTADGVSSVLGGADGFRVGYTDGNDSNAKVTSSTMFLTSSANTTATTISGVAVMFAKTGTNITYSMGYTGTTMQYNLHIKVEGM